MSLTYAINRAPLAILPAALLALACTRLNPDYCDSKTPCSNGRVCDEMTSTCKVAEATPDAPVEAPAPPRDAGAEAGDAKNSCASDDDCRSSPLGPTCVHGLCKMCQGANECRNSQFCAIDAGRCVECTDTEGCLNTPASPVCVQNRCTLCTERPSTCRERYPSTPVCAGDGTCVECLADGDCKSEGKAFCDAQTRKCVPCATDAQCAGKFGQDRGVCLAHLDGHCATADETVFVQQIASCSATIGAAGSATTPYCVAQDGVNAAVAGGKPLVVLRGPSDRWTFSSPAKPLLVVGQAGAKVVGAGVGIRASGGELYLRNLVVSVSGAIGTGVVAENGAVLHVSRCNVVGNGAGGISVNNAGYDIVNTIVADNAPGDSVPGTTFGGVYLNAATGKVQRFLNNTIVGNKATGLYCAGAYPVKGILVNGNAVREVFMCAPESSSTEAPLFDPARPYHLTAGSPCVNKGDPMEFPPDDIDGELRPQMGVSDCGADEFKPAP